MRYSIHQLNATTWVLRNRAGEEVGKFTDALGRTGYDLALAALGGLIRDAQLADANAGDGQAEGDGTGLLPTGWVSDEGICFSEELPGGRDFTECVWSSRDPQASLLPIMLQTETDYGHMGAELAGFFTEISVDGTPSARGRWYDTEIGRQARDLLLDGRRFGVSVDPTENVDVEYSYVCTQEDEDGFCEMAEERILFLAYEIGGMTLTPFPAFERASVIEDPNPAAPAAAASVRASSEGGLNIATRPPAAWLRLAEPQPGAPFLDALTGDDVLAEQIGPDGQIDGLACPLTIRDDGLVYGHLTHWGQCHTGNPWGPGVCASAEPSENGYADFLTGHVICDNGERVPTGELTVGCEHSTAMSASGVRDALAHAGMGWASVSIVDGVHGPWLCGVLRPELSEAQVRMLRGLALSGEWVGELGGILSVNRAGLPVQQSRIAASGFAGTPAPFVVPAAAVRASISGGQVTKLVGGTIVRACPECAARRAARAAGQNGNVTLAALARMERQLELLDLRTRHLIPAAAAASRDRLAASA